MFNFNWQWDFADNTILGEYAQEQFYYGVKTGYNEAFVINEDVRKELIGEDSNSENFIKPFLSGKNVKRYQTPIVNQYLRSPLKMMM